MAFVLTLEKFFWNLLIGLYCKGICYKQFDAFLSSPEYGLLCQGGEFKNVEIGWFPVKNKPRHVQTGIYKQGWLMETNKTGSFFQEKAAMEVLRSQFCVLTVWLVKEVEKIIDGFSQVQCCMFATFVPTSSLKSQDTLQEIPKRDLEQLLC